MFLRTICMHLFFSFFERRGPLNRLTALSSFAAVFIWSSRADGPASAFRPRKCMWNVKSIWKTIVWFSNWFRCCLPCRTKPKMLVSEGWRCVLWESTSLPAKRNAKSNKRLCLECLEVRTLSILFSCRSVQIPQQPGQHSLMLMSPLKLWRFEQLGCRRSQSIGMSLTPLIQFFGDVFVLDCHSHTHTHTRAIPSSRKPIHWRTTFCIDFPPVLSVLFPCWDLYLYVWQKKAMIWNHFGGHCVYIKVIINDLMTSVICVICLESNVTETRTCLHKFSVMM